MYIVLLWWIFEQLHKALKITFFLFNKIKAIIPVFDIEIIFPRHLFVQKFCIIFQLNYYLSQDVLQKLPSYCNGRIRSVAELQKFFGLYPEFHGKNELPYSPHQSHGATSKTNSPADFRQNSVSKFTKGPYFNYVSTFLTIFDQLSNLVSMFTKY